MIAIVDCNNFFVSCELTIRPELRGTPVIVGGNESGGGCAIAMSNEAKALGIPRGIPIFKIKHLINAHNITVLRSDHSFYSAISNRVMTALRSLGLKVEVYSIDEAFLHLPFEGHEAEQFCHYVRTFIEEQTGIPVGIGISTTKTLSKIAARFAKKHAGYRGVCLMDTTEKISKALSLTPIGEVWGIGRRSGSALTRVGIKTAARFAAMDLEWVKRTFAQPMADTWLELNGHYVLGEESHQRRYLSCTCSRTFDHDITELSRIRLLVARYASSVARSLRKHRRLATEIEVMLATNPYKPHLPQRSASTKIKLPEPTDDTRLITSASQEALIKTYAEGYAYKRAGVSATHTIATESRPLTLFTDVTSLRKSARLMQTIDSLNSEGMQIGIAAAAEQGPLLARLTKKD